MKRIYLIIGVAASLACLFTTACVSNKTNNQGVQISNPLNSNQSVQISNPLVNNEPIKEEELSHLGNHIYYPSDLFEGRNIDESKKKYVYEYMEDVDAGLLVDVYVTGFNNCYNSTDFMLYARQFYKGVVIPDVVYTTDYTNPNPNLILKSDINEVTNLDTSGILDPTTYISDVVEKAESNINKMYYDRNDKSIYGTYRLEYDVFEDRLYFLFSLNEYSDIKVDAKTGEIFDEYYWDGEMTD